MTVDLELFPNDNYHDIDHHNNVFWGHAPLVPIIGFQQKLSIKFVESACLLVGKGIGPHPISINHHKTKNALETNLFPVHAVLIIAIPRLRDQELDRQFNSLSQFLMFHSMKQKLKENFQSFEGLEKI